jgi:hypothetical protein
VCDSSVIGGELGDGGGSTAPDGTLAGGTDEAGGVTDAPGGRLVTGAPVVVVQQVVTGS